jgi:hypothetical protein
VDATVRIVPSLGPDPVTGKLLRMVSHVAARSRLAPTN